MSSVQRLFVNDCHMFLFAVGLVFVVRYSGLTETKRTKGSKAMYQNGEIEMVMDGFERAMKNAPIYTGGGFDRAERVEDESGDGRVSRRYQHNNYYNNGAVNSAFIAFLWGYSMGKANGR